MDLNALIHRITTFGLEAVGLYYSNYPAYVIENEDPLGQGRLLVLLGTILGPTSNPVWAYPKGSWSGDDCGIQIIPEIKDIVWVEFQNGKVTSPIWSFYFHHVDKKPEEFKSPKVYGLKTPAGYLVTIDEADDSVLIKSPKGPTVSIIKEVVEIKTPANTLTLDSTGISINANTNDIHIHNDTSSISITDSGVEVDCDKVITVGGKFEVLYSLVPGATVIADVKEIGVSKKVKVG